MKKISNVCITYATTKCELPLHLFKPPSDSQKYHQGHDCGVLCCSYSSGHKTITGKREKTSVTQNLFIFFFLMFLNCFFFFFLEKILKPDISSGWLKFFKWNNLRIHPRNEDGNKEIKEILSQNNNFLERHWFTFIFIRTCNLKGHSTNFTQEVMLLILWKQSLKKLPRWCNLNRKSTLQTRVVGFERTSIEAVRVELKTLSSCIMGIVAFSVFRRSTHTRDLKPG